MERAELAKRLGGVAARADRILIEEQDVGVFQRRFADAVASEAEVFLINPAWGAREREQLEQVLKTEPQPGARGWLMIPTGGTSGSVKFARHDSVTIAAAVDGFRRHFGLERVNAVNFLPLFHVSGLMAWMRCAITGGAHVAGDWKAIVAGEVAPRPAADWVTSLVPTQLERLLENENARRWLTQFRAVFVGGGPAWADLVARARGARVPIALTYGMTETAAMIAGLRPEEEPTAQTDCGVPMPHAEVTIDHAGAIAVTGESVFRGYFPALSGARTFVTQDTGEIRAGRVHVLGRLDGIIISGGEKIQPPEVESVLRATGEFADVLVIGLPHPEWGQQVVAAYPISRTPDLARVRGVLRDALAPYKQPKEYVAIDPWPVSEHGKINRAALADAARQAVGRISDPPRGLS